MKSKHSLKIFPQPLVKHWPTIGKLKASFGNLINTCSLSQFLYATIALTLCTSVENERSRTSCEFAMNCGPDSSHFAGTSWSLSVYIRISNAPKMGDNINHKRCKLCNSLGACHLM